MLLSRNSYHHLQPYLLSHLCPSHLYNHFRALEIGNDDYQTDSIHDFNQTWNSISKGREGKIMEVKPLEIGVLTFPLVFGELGSNGSETSRTVRIRVSTRHHQTGWQKFSTSEALNIEEFSTDFSESYQKLNLQSRSGPSFPVLTLLSYHPYLSENL